MAKPAAEGRHARMRLRLAWVLLALLALPASAQTVLQVPYDAAVIAWA